MDQSPPTALSTPGNNNTDHSDISNLHEYSTWSFLVPLNAKKLYHRSLKESRSVKCKNCPVQTRCCLNCEFNMIREYQKLAVKYFRLQRNRRECPFSLHNVIVRNITFEALLYFITDHFPESAQASHKLIDFKLQLLSGRTVPSNDVYFHKLYPEEQRAGKPLLSKSFMIGYW